MHARAMQPRGSDGEIVIRLNRVPANKVGQMEDYFKIINEQYTERYLHDLGVEPTDLRRRLVARHAPLAKCVIEASWMDDSAVAAELRVLQPPPGQRSPTSAGASPLKDRSLQ